MSELHNPLFLSCQFTGLKATDKKPPRVSARVNLNVDDTIYTNNIKSRTEVIGYKDSTTKLFVTHVPGSDEKNNTYHLFRQEAIRFAQQAIEQQLHSLQSMSEEEYKKAGYKAFNFISTSLYGSLHDRQDFYTDLQKQVNLVTSKAMPRINEYLLYEDDKEILPVTARVPYKNPRHQTLTQEQCDIVDAYLDVFLDNYNKRSLSWYLGAALLNIPIHDDRISKMMIVSSSHGGSGKSTLINSLSDALFTTDFRDIMDDFDGYFVANNRFGISSLSAKRLTIYSEAVFHYDATSEKHDFAGLNVSTIKSMITEGYVSNEAKYGARGIDRMNGFHVVITNHPPVVNENDEALNRRILPVMVKPTRMTTKAKKLNLWGKSHLTDYVKQHRQAFANYFVHTFLNDENAFTDVDYDHTDYVQEIKDSNNDLKRQELSSRQTINALRASGLVKVLQEIAEQEKWNLDPLITDVQEVISGGGNEQLSKHIRRTDNILYLDSSKAFLLRYGAHSVLLRNRLKDLFNEPEKKYHKRMFIIKLEEIDTSKNDTP